MPITSKELSCHITRLVNYAIDSGLTEQTDRVFCINSLLGALNITQYIKPAEPLEKAPLEKILGALCDYAYESGLIEKNSVTYRALFDTKLMGLLTPRPSEVITKFSAFYEFSPEAATDYFYHISRASDYIRTYRVSRDLKWTYKGKYGELDITVNLSKPEKEPTAIAAARNLPQSDYPKCLLCAENEGYFGNAVKPARQTLRLIPLSLAGNRWFMQYSPYVYYDEHCIVFSEEHTPMKINRGTFCRALDFVEYFPHYFIGSNADLPIVGGSILSHDHMQGGRYAFAMAKAPIDKPVCFDGFDDIEAGIVAWPMSVIRLRGENKELLVALADKILDAWRSYSDADAFVFAETDGEPHSTITPIARMRDKRLELDLVLRNNIRTDEHPLGVYHPHSRLHHIKKENIGLIEVMGLAVLPSRLRDEMTLMREYALCGKDFHTSTVLEKHADWFDGFKDSYTFTEDNVENILKTEIGRVFERVLEDAGVYKRNNVGQTAFLRFIDYVNNK